MNNGPMHVGKDEFHPGVKCYLDDLRIYNIVIRGNSLITYFQYNVNLFR